MTTTTSSPGHLICPFCASGALHPCALSSARCPACGRVCGWDVVETLRQISALPDALGAHACEECLHPEMRRLPDGAFRCPACGAEVSPPREPQSGGGDPLDEQ